MDACKKQNKTNIEYDAYKQKTLLFLPTGICLTFVIATYNEMNEPVSMTTISH